MKKVTSFKSQVSSIGFAARKGKLCGGAGKRLAGLRSEVRLRRVKQRLRREDVQ